MKTSLHVDKIYVDISYYKESALLGYPIIYGMVDKTLVHTAYTEAMITNTNAYTKNAMRSMAVANSSQ